MLHHRVLLVARFLSLVWLALAATPLVTAQTSTSWLGSGTDWHDPFAWSAGVPTSRVDAVINAGTLNPIISQPAVCRSLTVGVSKTLAISAGAELNVYGSVQAGGQVNGSGLLRIANGPLAVAARGQFQNIECANSAGVRMGDMRVTGRVIVSSGTVTLLRNCRFGSLEIQTGDVLVDATAPSGGLVVEGRLAVGNAVSVRVRLVNESASPIVVLGDTTEVFGELRGAVQFEPSSDASLRVWGTTIGVADVRLLGSTTTMTVECSSGGQLDVIQSPLPQYGYSGRLLLRNVRCNRLDISAMVVVIAGLVVCDNFKMNVLTQLEGDTASELHVGELLVNVSGVYRPDLGGLLRLIQVSRRLKVNLSNTFQPVRSVIRLQPPLDGGSLLMDLDRDAIGNLGRIEVADGAQLAIRSSGDPGDNPIMDTLTIGTGAVVTVTDFVVGNVDIANGASLTVSDTQPAGFPTALGSGTVRGVLAMAADVQLANLTGQGPSSNLVVAPGGELQATARPWDSVLDIAGTLRIERDGGLALLPGSCSPACPAGLMVSTTGRLVLDGTPSEPAVIAGNNSPMALDGEITARGFRISGMDVAGVRIGASARFGNPADDRNFQGGHFTGGQPGGVLLHMERPQTTRLWDIDFDNTGGATRNVRCTAGSAITFVDSRGNLAGEAFDDDPGARVRFVANTTAIGSLTAAPQIHRNVVSFVSSVEETSAFRVLRLPGTGLAPLSAQGASSAYTAIDDGLLAGTRLSYRVQRQRWSPLSGAGEWQDVGTATASATPHARDEGNTRFVGVNGYADIGAALSGAPPGTTVHVEAGSYPGFAVSRSVRILGSGAVSVTSPVTATFAGSVGEVMLEGLTFESAASLTLHDLAVPVLVRRCSLSAAMTIARCSKVALQRLTTASSMLLTGAEVHAWNCTLATVQAQQGSQFVRAGGSATVQADATSTSVVRTGPTVSLTTPVAWPSGGTQTLSIAQGTPGLPFGLLLGVSLDHVDISSFFPYDMRLLTPFSELIVLLMGNLDASGRASIPIPAPPSSAAGGSVLFQVYTLDLTTLQGRMGEACPVVFLR